MSSEDFSHYLDEWYYSDSEPEFDTVEICSVCKEETLCDFINDPYLESEHPEQNNPKDWRCYKCYYSRKDQIK